MKKIISLIALLAFAFAISGVSSVSMAQTAAETDLQSSVSDLRKNIQVFKDSRSEEEKEKLLAAQEKTMAKRKIIEQRRVEAEKNREEERKKILLKLIDIQIKHLTNINERVQKMPNITSELKAQLKVEIDKSIQLLVAEKEKVTVASGQEDMKKLAKEVRDLFKAKLDIVKKIVDAIHSSRAEKTVSIAEERVDAIKSKIAELKSKGQDTSALDADLEDAEESIEDAKVNVEKKEFLEANENLKGAYQKFREIAQKAKGL